MRWQPPPPPTPTPDQVRVTIADLTIALRGADPELDLQVAGAMGKFLDAAATPDVRVRAAWSELGEETGGAKLFDSGGVWQLYAEDNAYWFRFVSPRLGPLPYKVARFNRDFTCGEIWLHRPYFPIGHAMSPLEYPLDELLMVNLLATGQGVEVHACGVVDSQGRGHLFLGQSGAGKTTLARLWQTQEGVTILSDDRIILRTLDHQLWMYGTPWHGEAELACATRAPLTCIYFVHHGQHNALLRQGCTEAMGRLFACSFAPFYSPGALDFTLGFLEQVTNTVPCYELRFVPDTRVVPFLQVRIAA